MTRFQGFFTLSTATCFVLSGAWFGYVVGAETIATFDIPLKGTAIATAGRVVHGNMARVDGKALSTGESYLLVGVNADDAPAKPALEAIWAVTFTPDYSMVELLGLAPTAAMKAAFSERSSEFGDLVSARLPAPLRKQFILDSSQFIWIIDTLGGVRLTGEVLNGANTLEYVRGGRDIDEQLLRQAAAVQALVAQEAVLGQRANLSAVLEKVRRGALSYKEMNVITDNFFPLQIERVRVRAMTAKATAATTLKLPE